GVTTHYGIRTGSVHITKFEYERLNSLGIQHLAARIAHEVSEIDSWRKKANDLIEDGRINELGAIPGEYDENWASGIRKWIKENCEDSGRGVAQQLGREFHRKGVESEIAILSEWILSEKVIGTGEQYYEAVKDLSQEFISGRYEDFINNPAIAVPDSRGMYGDIFKSILDTLKHFRTKRDREFFINSLYARSTLNYAQSLNGGIEAEFAALKDTSTRSRNTLKRIDILKAGLNNVEVIDSITRAEIEKWVDEVKKAITNFSLRDKGIFGTIFAKLIKLVSRKHRAEGWDSVYVVDPNDFIGSSTDPDGEEGEDGSIEESDIDFSVDPADNKGTVSDTGTGPSERFGIMFAPAVANCIMPQQKAITRTLDVDPGIINILARYKNWNYQDISERARSTSASGSKKRDTTDRSLQRSTRYVYIDRFNNENIFRKRLSYATSSAKHLINSEEILKSTKGSRNFRIFYGSNSGYFDVYDKSKEYAHQIEITILVDGKKELQTETYGPQNDMIASIMREFAVRPGDEDVFAPIRGITLHVVGTETIREAFQGQPGMVFSKDEEERRADLQRTFIRLYREDIQVAGSNFVEEDKGFAERLPSFERIYISELVGRLDRIVEERQRLQDDRTKVALTELSPDDERKLSEIERSLEEDERTKKGLETRLGQLEERKRKLEEERKRLTNHSDYFAAYKQRYEAGEVTAEEATKYPQIVSQYNQDLAVYRQDLESISQEDGSIKGEQGALLKNMTRKEGAVKGLRERKKRAKGMRQAFEFQMRNIERHYELICKRIEDAQVGHPLTTGVVINNRYKVLDLLGEGGFGRVYRVRDRELNTEKAIKIMSPTQHMSLLEKQNALLGYDRELNSLISLRTKGAQVPYVEGKGVYAGSQFIVMSLEKGLTLEEIILKCEKGEMQLSLRQRLLLMYGVAKTMANFHACEYIHRDLKPANIMIPVNEDGSLAIPNIGDTEQLMKSASFDAFVRNIRILDLGSAIPGEVSDKKATGDFREKLDRTNLTGEGKIRGTPWYMAPEQCVPSKDNPISSKTDIYALGVLFYRFLSQHFPRGEGVEEGWNNIVLSHCSFDPIYSLFSMIDWENKELQRKREEAREVNVKRLNAIKDGLDKALARETRPERRIIRRGKGGKLVWAKKVMDETALIETLGNISWLTDVERDKIRALVVHKVPQVDAFVEAIVHKMLEGISQDIKGKVSGARTVQKDRPTAIDVAHELEKYLTGKKDDMLWRPRGEKKARIVKMAEWLQKHYGLVAGIFATVIIGLGGLVVFLFVLYEKAAIERSLAQRETQQAREEKKAAVVAAEKAQKDVQEAEDKMRQLQEERKKIQGNLVTLKEEKGAVEAQTKSLSEQVKALSDKAKKAVELEGQLKALEKRVGELNEQEGNLKKREQELNRRIKESRDR
ncbi:protein kinase, partial [Candidatus Omnitrophota bacterium]